jgi:hypothetical protein
VENESRKSNEICQANAVNSMKRTVLWILIYFYCLNLTTFWKNKKSR